MPDENDPIQHFLSIRETGQDLMTLFEIVCQKYRIPKDRGRTAKYKLRSAIDLITDKDQKMYIDDEDLAKIMFMVQDLVRGDHKKLLFEITEDGQFCYEVFTDIKFSLKSKIT